MTEKQLSNYYWLKKEIKDLEDRINELGCGLGSIKFDDEIKGGGNNTTIQEKIVMLKDLYMEKRITALEEYLKIEKYISSVDDPEIRTIMRLRFLDLKSWEEIGNEMYSDRTTVSKKMRRYFKSNTFPTIPIKK